MIGENILAQWLQAGDKPVVPDFPTVNTSDEIGKALSANLANFGSASNLASKTNKFNFDEIQKMLRESIPQYDEMMKSGSSVIASELKGEIPADVAAQITRSGAVKALTGGFAGSGMHGNLLAKDLGLGSLEIMNRGIGAAERWIASARSTIPQFNVASMFISPAQQIAVTSANNENTFRRQWLSNRIDAMPDPTMAAIGRGIEIESQQIAQLASSALGSVGGMMGGGGGGGGGGKSGGYNMQSYGAENGTIGSPGVSGGGFYDYNPGQNGGWA